MNCECGSSAVTFELRTGADGGPSGVVSRCQECGRQWSAEAFKPAPSSVATARLPNVAPQPKPAIAATKKLNERSLIAEAKRQVKQLDREISRLEKLKHQRAQLARLLDAAKSADGPRVVPMRRAENSR